MRIWSLHPAHLDRAGLIAGWREALLAQAVLAGRTRGYRHHPQLLRFRESSHSLDAIGAYLKGLHQEAQERGYRFDERRILATVVSTPRLSVTVGQIDYEWAHLGRKLAKRSPDDALRWQLSTPRPHALFDVVPGDIASWERH